ncbi:hypothetical protein GCM10012284_43120 [Mangrovihabitans endophyticus]|uniref:PH domain-containing protein n=1 Tax=Mangrovihabitans endophyticus TaxID=1751298 RepID=A0A8J3C3F5_9ACTN|nr:hypothetical protein GCM10012284_43120 [Mangrovihabitans endophyticus]
MFVTVLWVVAAVWAACRGLSLLILLAAGARVTVADLIGVGESLLVVPAVATCVIMLVAWNRLGWLRSNVHGVEFAATGRRGVRLPWSAIAAVALRRRGPFTELVVTPSAAGAITVADGPGRAPRTRRRGAEVAYLVDVGLMSPGPRTLLAELHRRLPGKV